MRAHRPVPALAALLAVAAALAGPVSVHASIALPRVMAAAGDSITRGFDSSGSCFLKDCPQNSWATGTAVNSQYERLLAARDTGLTAYNDAVTGANMSGLASQLTAAAGQGAGYVAILMGANDVCASDITAATPAATFQSEFQAGLSGFFAADPTAYVYVSSLPNLVQLYNALKSNFWAQFYWHLLNTCADVLVKTGEQPQVTQLEALDNAALQSVCAAFTHCLYDGGAGYATQFTAADISTLDYFHPNVTGQNLIAGVTWQHGYWPSLK